ncbi:MAG TPA: glycosyltransferase family 2 protein [Candidatus Baltobacteraceae bacterium]|nr:glycosyltransferase family 2 protein [Candidatus Baltobacteraceae bacterium]
MTLPSSPSARTFTVCVPSYNAERVIGETLRSLVRQTFEDWECLVVDDGSTDGTEAIVRSIPDARIRFARNATNLGCAGNFQRCRDLATGKFIYFLANDDIIAPHALERTLQAFEEHPDAGVVTRPYYWFRDDAPDVPVRRTKPLDPVRDRVITTSDDPDSFRMLLDVLGQVSGLAFRNSALKHPFNAQVWTTHIEPFLATLKEHPGVFMHDYLLAVRTEHSQARRLPKIYDPSPLWCWIDMFERLYPDPQWSAQRKVGIDFLASRVEGLVQLRCHSTLQRFIREAWLYLRFRPANAASARYWFFALGCLCMPPRLLRKFVDWCLPRVTSAQRLDLAPIGR